MKKVKIFYSVYNRILDFFKNAPIESGGVIATDENNIICDFDFCAGHSDREFTIDPNVFNPVISLWYEAGKNFAGIIHSHPNGLAILSMRDREYAEKILRVNSFMCDIKMGIVTVNGSSVQLNLYCVCKSLCEEIFVELI